MELLILFEQWAGHRLLSEKVTRPHVRPVSEGIEIRQGCQFISSLVGALSKLPGGLGRFSAMWCWSPLEKASSFGVESMFPWGLPQDPTTHQDQR